MSKYNPVTPELLEELEKVVGAANVKTDAETLDRFKTDEETDPRLMHLPEVVVWVNSTEEEWNENVEKFHREAYPYVYSLGGRLSGEHGIGAKKLHYMEEYTEPAELEYMRMIKRAVDPKNILNPGKIFNV